MEVGDSRKPGREDPGLHRWQLARGRRHWRAQEGSGAVGFVRDGEACASLPDPSSRAWETRYSDPTTSFLTVNIK